MYNSAIIANRIKALVKLRHKSLKSLCEECGIGRNTMSHMTNGSIPKSDNLAKIADYLDCSVDYLLGRTDNKSVKPTDESIVDNEIMTNNEKELIRLYRKMDLMNQNELINTMIENLNKTKKD